MMVRWPRGMVRVRRSHSKDRRRAKDMVGFYLDGGANTGTWVLDCADDEVDSLLGRVWVVRMRRCGAGEERRWACACGFGVVAADQYATG